MSSREVGVFLCSAALLFKSMNSVLKLNLSKGILKKELVQSQKESSKKEKSHRMKKQHEALQWVALELVTFIQQ